MPKLQKIKTLLNIKDSLQDDMLNIIIDNVTDHLQALLGEIPPPQLDFIVEEISIRRFNRIGTEGMQSESVEGHSISFYDLDDYFKPYENIIDKYKTDDGTSGKSRGKVMFI